MLASPPLQMLVSHVSTELVTVRRKSFEMLDLGGVRMNRLRVASSRPRLFFLDGGIDLNVAALAGLRSQAATTGGGSRLGITLRKF